MQGSIILFPIQATFVVGDRVWVGGSKPGTVRYIGETKFAPGEWAGVELDAALGKNDGTVGGEQYFSCPPMHGVFSRCNRLSRHQVECVQDLDSYIFSARAQLLLKPRALHGEEKAGEPNKSQTIVDP